MNRLPSVRAVPRWYRRHLPAFRVVAILTVAALTLALLSGPAFAQKQRLFDVQTIQLNAGSGLQRNSGSGEATAFRRALRYEGADWIRVEMTGVRLNAGDYIRITSAGGAQEQIIRHDDPQLSEPSFAGRVFSVIFGGGSVDVELVLAPWSRDAAVVVDRVVVAAGGGIQRSLCGGDNRVPANDPCIVRIVDSKGGWGTGFMISNNWMITAHHVMTDGPWTVQRNVQPSDSATGGIKPPTAANDQFPVANLTTSMTSGVGAFGNDWAVVNVPNNAGGAPGAGCSPSFNCKHRNTTSGASLTVKGFGIDSENWRNGTLQTHSDTSVAGGANDCHFRYKVDTEANNSGSPVTDGAGKIVGIHTNGGCQADGSGSNSGTLISNPGLLAAIKKLCGTNPCPDILPTITCVAVSGSTNCCTFQWEVRNNGPKPLTEFYVDIEAGTGGPCGAGDPLVDVTAPPGFNKSFCYNWDGSVPSNWSVMCFMGGSIPPNGTATGTFTVKTNHGMPTNVTIPGWIPFTVAANSIQCHATSFSPTALMKNCAAGQFGPHLINQVDSWSGGGPWTWEPPVATELRRYDARVHDAHIVVSWELAERSTGDTFIIRRASDDGGFREIPNLTIRAISDLIFEVRDADVAPNTQYRYRVETSGLDGTRELFTTTPVVTPRVETALGQNHPNPFNPQTTIEYVVGSHDHVLLQVFDSAGRLVRTLVDGAKAPSAAPYLATWDGRDDAGRGVASGVYFYRLTAGQQLLTRKMVLLK